MAPSAKVTTGLVVAAIVTTVVLTVAVVAMEVGPVSGLPSVGLVVVATRPLVAVAVVVPTVLLVVTPTAATMTVVVSTPIAVGQHTTSRPSCFCVMALSAVIAVAMAPRVTVAAVAYVVVTTF